MHLQMVVKYKLKHKQHISLTVMKLLGITKVYGRRLFNKLKFYIILPDKLEYEEKVESYLVKSCFYLTNQLELDTQTNKFTTALFILRATCYKLKAFHFM